MHSPLSRAKISPRVSTKELELVHSVDRRLSPAAGAGEVKSPNLAGIKMQGYLLKKKVKGGTISWQSRYFLLTEHTLAFYESKEDAFDVDGVPKGDILLDKESKVTVASQPDYPHCLLLSSPSIKPAYLSAASEGERDAWRAALEETFENMDLKVPTAKVVAITQIKASTTIEWNSMSLTFHIKTPGEENKRGTVFKCDSKDEWQRWRDFLKSRILSHKNQEHSKTYIMSGYLTTRPFDGGEAWQTFYYTLNKTHLCQYVDEDKEEPALNVWPLSINCTVYETSFKSWSFQLVTSKNAFHGQGASKEETTAWINALRQIITTCQLDPSDPLLREAMQKEDSFYDVVFNEKKPLGIVLERSGDWAIVKACNNPNIKVQKGSAISFINAKSVVLSSYEATTQLLSRWQPPLVIAFRAVPTKEGWLRKLSESKGSKIGQWKQRYFKLEGGHLKYFDSDGADEDIKGDVKLMGCGVSLIPHKEIRQYFCLRLVSGLTTLCLQASNKEEMMDWAVMLYQAVATANGGGYLLLKECQRIQQNAEEEQQVSSSSATIDEMDKSNGESDWSDFLSMGSTSPQRSKKGGGGGGGVSTPTKDTKKKRAYLVPLDDEEEMPPMPQIVTQQPRRVLEPCITPPLPPHDELATEDLPVHSVNKNLGNESSEDEDEGDQQEQEGYAWEEQEAVSYADSQAVAEKESTTTADVILAGYLDTRPEDGGEDWMPYFYTLSSQAFTQYLDEAMTEVLQTFHFNVNCAVFETNLHPYSFQLVTCGSIFHGQGKDKEDSMAWISAIRQILSQCKLDMGDILCREALKIEDDFYQVTFKEKKPLGIVLERANHWGLIKLSQNKDSSIQVGSALSFINDVSVVLEDYKTTTDTLAGWQPPLTLGFRRTPLMAGWLKKQSQTVSSKTGKHKWRPRFFRLAAGHLQYFDREDAKEEIKGDIKLMGCAVSLVRYSLINKPFAFRLHSGLEVLTLQSSSKEEMMQWATMLYHAVAIANGGGYLLVKERIKTLEAQMQNKTLEEMLQQQEHEQQQLQHYEVLPMSSSNELVQQHHHHYETEEEEEEEEEGEEEEEAHFKPQRKAATNALVDVDEEPSPPLTDEHIAFAFSSLNMGYTGADRNMLRPIHFCHFIRIVTGKQNLFFELDTFHKHFDKENNGFVTLAEFQEGVHRLETLDPKHLVIVGLKAFVRHSLISL